YRPVGWLTAGAIREDDAAVALHFPDIYIGEDRSLANDILMNDSPIGGHVNRFCNHFYDAYKGASNSLEVTKYDALPYCSRTGLTGLSSWGIAAPAWALALQTGTTVFQATADVGSRANHFAIADAKEAMWRAATGYDGAMLMKVASNGAERMKYWATMFRSLGGAVHLLQDMAQPQHTRNESHPWSLNAVGTHHL
ncbi:MAG: hypothetical protein LC098_00485, partial [Burkholderiales bacterium]|nr:hypothetical protein [Burkholderiales bacterium]